MNEPSCAACEFMWSERWPKNVEALRCGNEAGGFRCGHVTKLIPARKLLFAEGPAPAWCPMRKAVEINAV